MERVPSGVIVGFWLFVLLELLLFWFGVLLFELLFGLFGIVGFIGVIRFVGVGATYEPPPGPGVGLVVLLLLLLFPLLPPLLLEGEVIVILNSYSLSFPAGSLAFIFMV